MAQSRLRQFFQRRRSTHELARALAQADLKGARLALEAGADVVGVCDEFEEPGQHFQMLYAVRGALELAVEHRLPWEFFEMLIEHGAKVPTYPDGSPRVRGLFGDTDAARWSRNQGLGERIERAVFERDGMGQGLVHPSPVPGRQGMRP